MTRMRMGIGIIVVLGFIVVAAAISMRLLEFHGTAEIRLDCGDLRYRFHGVTVSRRPMAEPQRKILLALAAKSSVPKGTWCRCATFPLAGSNSTDRMCQGFYPMIVPWIDVDPVLAQLMLEDVADYIQRTKGEQGLPTCTVLAPWCFEHDDKNNVLSPYKVRADWRESELLQRAIQDPHANLSPVIRRLKK